MATYHVLPVDDIKSHEESTTCECEPRCEWQPNGDLIVVHSAWDGREALEEFYETLNDTDMTAFTTPVTTQPVGKVHWFRKLLSKLPGFCSYCGKRYVDCHSKNINVLFPLPQNGKCCPDGHEGYVEEFIGFGTVRNRFDFIKSDNKK